MSSKDAKNDNQSSSQARRRLLKALGTGGGILAAGAAAPDKWGKPVVDAVLLPAHAVTSEQTEPSPSLNDFVRCCFTYSPMMNTLKEASAQLLSDGITVMASLAGTPCSITLADVVTSGGGLAEWTSGMGGNITGTCTSTPSSITVTFTANGYENCVVTDNNPAAGDEVCGVE